MAITSLTQLVQSLGNNPTTLNKTITTDGTSVTTLRSNPIAKNLQSLPDVTVTQTQPVSVIDSAGAVTIVSTADPALTDLTTRQATLSDQIVATGTRVTAVEDRATTLETTTSSLGDRATTLETTTSSLEDRASALETNPTFVGTIQGDDISIDNNVISTTNSNSNLELRANGTGKIIVDSIQLSGNTISTTDSSGIVIAEALTALSSLTVDDDITITGGNLTTAGSVTATNGWNGTGSAANAIAGIPQIVTVERGSVGSAFTGLAFGNGSTGNGMRMPYAGKIILATLHCTALNGTWSAYLEVNGVTNASYELSATASTADAGDTDYFTTPYSFSAGDAINWQQQSVPVGCTTSVISFWVVFD